MESGPQVVVIGGGLVGLSQALFLAYHGIRVLLLERRSEPSVHPRAMGFTTRTLELLRSVGLERDVPCVASDFQLRRVRVHSLAGEWYEELPWGDSEADRKHGSDLEFFSPCKQAGIPQDKLEPLLMRRAAELGADIRMGHEVLHLSHDENGVCVTFAAVRADRHLDPESEIIRAPFAVAADGCHSKIRESLGISRSGRGVLRTLRSVLFRAPLDEYLCRGPSQFQIDQPEFRAFLTTYRDGRWVLMFADDKERSHEELLQCIRTAVGKDEELQVEIITTGRWEMAAKIADTFVGGDRRVFLVGDAAHVLPPARGGYGANTGIEDAHNLAWKLAQVLREQIPFSFLTTYDQERRPIAWLRHRQIFARRDYSADRGPLEVEVPLDDVAIELGARYIAANVLDGNDGSVVRALRPDQWHGQPGTRAPHVWLQPSLPSSMRTSILDLFQRSWIILSLFESLEIDARYTSFVQKLVPTVDFHPENLNQFLCLYGMEDPNSVVLIRPDGYIAWHSAFAGNTSEWTGVFE